MDVVFQSLRINWLHILSKNKDYMESMRVTFLFISDKEEEDMNIYISGTRWQINISSGLVDLNNEWGVILGSRFVGSSSKK